MKFIKQYEGYEGANLLLPNGISLSSEEQGKMRLIIFDALNKIYKIKERKYPFLYNGVLLNPEYLSKAMNNRTLLKKIVYDDNKEIISGVKNKEELFKFVEENLYNLFHPKGIYFGAVYNLLSNTSKKGSSLENKSFDLFIRIASSKGVNVVIESPTIEEDKSGIDGIFTLKGKRYTIQVKPLFKIEDYKIDNTKFIAFCDGVLTQLKTDYLIVSNQYQTRIFRSKGIEAKGSYFLIPKGNEVN
jgi:hypothetical protein